MAKLTIFTPSEAGLQAILDLLRFTGAIQLSVPDGNQEPKVVESPAPAPAKPAKPATRKPIRKAPTQ
jgi:hypothetical protein